jgi:hypothetical protein
MEKYSVVSKWFNFDKARHSFLPTSSPRSVYMLRNTYSDPYNMSRLSFTLTLLEDGNVVDYLQGETQKEEFDKELEKNVQVMLSEAAALAK